MKNINSKIVIIGAGHAGVSCAQSLIFSHEVKEVVLIDPQKERVDAEAIDLNDMATALQIPTEIYRGDYSDIGDADIMVMTAGRSRLPGEKRSEMLRGTIETLNKIIPDIQRSGFDGIIISVSNPADVVADYLRKKLDFPRFRLFSTGTALDSIRAQKIIADALGLRKNLIDAMCLGLHGEESFLLRSHLYIEELEFGKYLELNPNFKNTLDLREIDAKNHATGSQIVSGKGCTQYGIGGIVSKVASSILRNERVIIPLSTQLNGEYGIDDLTLSVPCLIGNRGIEKIVPLPLSEDEELKMKKCAEIARKQIEGIANYD